MKFSAFYWTPMFITVLTRECYRSLSQFNPPSFFRRSVLILFTPSSPKQSLYLRLSDKNIKVIILILVSFYELWISSLGNFLHYPSASPLKGHVSSSEFSSQIFCLCSFSNLIIIINFHSLLIYVLISTARGQLQSRHEYKHQRQ
jgi:hypothetical protein